MSDQVAQAGNRVQFMNEGANKYSIKLVDEQNNTKELYEIEYKVEVNRFKRKFVQLCPCSLVTVSLIMIWIFSIIFAGGVAICLYYANL